MATRFECNPRRPGKYGIEGFYTIEHLADDGTENKVQEQFYLFRVKVAWQEQWPEGARMAHHVEEVFVLAQTADDAVGQATCALKLDPLGHQNRPGLIKESVTAVAERVPFYVRGWSGQQF